MRRISEALWSVGFAVLSFVIALMLTMWAWAIFKLLIAVAAALIIAVCFLFL